MKKFNFLFKALLIGALSFCLMSCSDDEDEISYSMSNQDFITKASSSNMLEIAAGGLAVEHGTHAAVKTFGQHMITDHGQAATEMAALANKKGWSIPGTMLAAHQQKLDALKNLTGAAFDEQFANLMVTSHQETIALFEQAAMNEGVPDGELRAFASGKLPTLKHHLEEATELKADVDDE